MTVNNEPRGKKGAAGVSVAGEASGAGVLGNFVGPIKELKHPAAGEYEFVFNEEAPHGWSGSIAGQVIAGFYQVLATTKTTIKFKFTEKEGLAIDAAFTFLIGAF